LTVYDGEQYSLAAQTTASISASTVDETFADFEVNSQGTVGGNFLDTHDSDDVYETITEELYAGNKRSRLEHQWTFNVASGSSHKLTVEAHHNSTTEDFIFEYSNDGGLTWNFLFVVTSGTDEIYTAAIDAGVGGEILVRVKDTDRSRGENTPDTLFVDDMFITTEP
ncbi:unnamed protein product, partial [marine sediment metagenome]